MPTNYGHYFKRYCNNLNFLYNLKEDHVVAELFPSILVGSKKFDANGSCPLIDYITDTWTQPTRMNIVLVGDGGSGKTTNLLTTYQHFISREVNCAFIPLSHLEGTEEATIEWYFREYIMNSRQDTFSDFLESISHYNQRFGQPSLILFLDGYNEIYKSKNQLYKNIHKWLSYNNVQIVISVRENMSDISHFKNSATELATLQPLDHDRMLDYVRKTIPSINLKHVSPFVLGNPMLLSLFVSTQNYIDKHSENFMIHLRNDYTPGCIIWNYMQLQILKYHEQLRGLEVFGNEQCDLIAIINCILPYIGWKMAKEQRLTISRKDFEESIRNSYQVNLDTCKKLLEECMLENCITWDFHEKSIMEIILNNLGFFKKNEDMIQFRHQYYRDFFSAFYFYTNLFTKDISMPQFLSIWCTELIPFDVLRFFCDLLDKPQIQKLTMYCGNVAARETNYAIDNLFQVYRIVYEGNLSHVALNHLNLSGIYLNQYSLVQNGTSTEFAECTLSNASFYGDGHHGRVITAEYSPDEMYIASSCTAGEINVWLAGSGKKTLELNESSSVYSLCWISQHEFLYGTLDGSCYCYNINQRKKNKLFEIGLTGIRTVCFHKQYLYVGCTNGSLHRGVIDQGTIHHVNPLLSLPNAIIRIICNRETVFLLDSEGCVWMLGLEDSTSHPMNTSGHRVTDLCCNKQLIIACTADGYILKWNRDQLPMSHSCEPMIQIITPNFRFSSIRAYESKLLLGTQNGEVVIWDMDKADILLLPIDHLGWVRTASYSSKQKEIISAGSDGKVILWDINSLSKKSEKCGIPNMVLCHDYLQNSNIIISASNDCKVIVWDLDSQLKVQELIGHIDWVRCIATGHKHDIIASGGSDGRINIWSIQNRDEFLFTNTLLYQGPSWIMSLDWNHDDSALIGSMRSGEIHLWVKENQHFVDHLLYSHSSSALCARFSPNGRYIASADQNGHIFIYDYKYTSIYKVSDHPIRQIRWSDDELYLYACCLDGRIVKYKVENQSLIEIDQINFCGVRSIELIDGNLMFAGNNQELWMTNTYHKSTFIDKLHLDAIDYIAQNRNFYSTSGHDGYIIVRSKHTANDIIVLRLIPSINISGCKFKNCTFENAELLHVLKMNGGIITDNSLS